MAKPDSDCLHRARRYYALERQDESGACGRVADLNVYRSRGHERIPALVRDSVREERATRHWFAHRQGGWTPIDIVLRSPLNETEAWYDPRGRQ